MVTNNPISVDELKDKIHEIENNIEDKAGNISNIEEWSGLSDNEKKEIKHCYKRIVMLVSYKERCVEELRDRLVNKEKYDEVIFKKAIKKALQHDIVNDKRFSELYALNKFADNRGVDGVIKYLDKMKIPYKENDYLCTIIDLEKEKEINKALNVLEVKPPRSKNVYTGAIRKLICRGFSIDVSDKAVKIWIENTKN